jgi:hypothetical protein
MVPFVVRCSTLLAYSGNATGADEGYRRRLHYL